MKNINNIFSLEGNRKISIVGGAENERAELKGRLTENYAKGRNNKFLSEVRNNEYEKSDLENEIIDACNAVTNEYLEHLGFEKVDFPRENVHIVGSNFFKTKIGSSSAGAHSPLNGRIFLDHDLAARSPYLELEDILHELIHAKGYTSFKINKSNERYVSRQGLSMQNKNQDKETFDHQLNLLNEMVVAELEKRLYDKVIGQIDFFKQNDSMNENDNKKFEENLSSLSSRVGTTNDEILFMADDGKAYKYSYTKSRKLLSLIVEGIYDVGIFKSKDEVYDIFFKAHFSGDMKEIFELMRKAFDQDVYKIIKGLNYNQKEIDDVEILLRKRMQSKLAA